MDTETFLLLEEQVAKSSRPSHPLDTASYAWVRRCYDYPLPTEEDLKQESCGRSSRAAQMGPPAPTPEFYLPAMLLCAAFSFKRPQGLIIAAMLKTYFPCAC